MSLSTFKQYCPEHIVLAFFTKFRQCLCEKYENSVLLMNVVNCHVSDDRKAKSVDELVNHTLCVPFRRQSIDRLCPECGVKRFIYKVND